jgi:hypothetical protein
MFTGHGTGRDRKGIIQAGRDGIQLLQQVRRDGTGRFFTVVTVSVEDKPMSRSRFVPG